MKTTGMLDLLQKYDRGTNIKTKIKAAKYFLIENNYLYSVYSILMFAIRYSLCLFILLLPNAMLQLKIRPYHRLTIIGKS